MSQNNMVFDFYAISDFNAFCNLARTDLHEFSELKYRCQEGLDFCRPSLNWFLSKGISESSAKHCISLDHGRTVSGCTVDRGGWIFICHNCKEFAAFPYIETIGGDIIALYYDLTWLARLPGVTKTGDKYRIESIHEKHVVELPERACVIPGSSNPSHFVEHLVKHEVLATCADLARFVPIAMELTGWQQTLVARIGAEYHSRLQFCHLHAENGPVTYRMRFKHGFIFEEIPQWLGLQHARRIIRQMRIARSSHNGSGIVYLCRAKTELANRVPLHRVEDYLKVCRLVVGLGGAVVFPEMHTPAQVQRIIASSATIIADPGSCNIHALWSPMVGKSENKVFHQLTPLGPFASASHDAARGFEWFCNLEGSRFSFVFGISEQKDCYSGSVQVARYRDAVAKLVGAH